jgi:hypothetical protein
VSVNGCRNSIPYAEKPVDDEDWRAHHCAETEACCEETVGRGGVSNASPRTVSFEQFGGEDGGRDDMGCKDDLAGASIVIYEG